MITTALAILTYVGTYRPDMVRQRLAKTLCSLRATQYTDPVFIVDDGSTDNEHLAHLTKLEAATEFTVVRRMQRGGISCGKNTCLKALSDTGADILFLADDDMLFRTGWNTAYAAAMLGSGVHHFSWCNHAVHRVQPQAVNYYTILKTFGTYGSFLTCTPRMLQDVGGFKVFPAYYGYEHANWTRRAMLAGFCPFYADILESNTLLTILADVEYKFPSASSPEEKHVGLLQNARSSVDMTIYQPLTE